MRGKPEKQSLGTWALSYTRGLQGKSTAPRKLDFEICRGIFDYHIAHNWSLADKNQR